jgi:hypothetical protein
MMHSHKLLLESDHIFSTPASGLEYDINNSQCDSVSSHPLSNRQDHQDHCQNLSDRHASLMITGCKGIEDIEEMIQNSEHMEGEMAGVEGEGDEVINDENTVDNDQEEVEKSGKLSKKRNRRDRDSNTSSSSTVTSKKVSFSFTHKPLIERIIKILATSYIVTTLYLFHTIDILEIEFLTC